MLLFLSGDGTCLSLASWSTLQYICIGGAMKKNNKQGGRGEGAFCAFSRQASQQPETRLCSSTSCLAGLGSSLSWFPWVNRNPLSHAHLLALQLSVLHICKRKTHTHGFRCCLNPKWKNYCRNQVAVFKFYASSPGSRCKEIHMFMFIGVHGQVKPVSHLAACFRVSKCLP